MPPLGSFQDMTGTRFGRWTVAGFAFRKNSRIFWDCVCDCGTTGQIDACSLRHGESKSCGCLKREIRRKGDLKHGLHRSPEYGVYQAMRGRCENPRHHAYSGYGGRGITVCERWKTFEAFYADMCPRPEGRVTLERIDNNLGYSPENCRWATMLEQSKNRRNTRLITFRGKTQCHSDWCREMGIHPATYNNRIRRGWTIERALTEPPVDPIEASRRAHIGRYGKRA